MFEGDCRVGTEDIGGKRYLLTRIVFGQRLKTAEQFVGCGIDRFDGHAVVVYSDASLARAWARTRVPRAISAGAGYSSGRWLTPLRQAIKIMAMGAMRAIKSESW